MSYKLRLVQKFKQNKHKEFMELERKFVDLENEMPEFPKGKRYVPYSGREPENTLIWECEFESIEDVNKALSFLANDPRHDELHEKQLEYFVESYIEIYKLMD